MLVCRDIAYYKNEKGVVSETRTYDRVYFEYGPNDPTEEKEVKVDGKVIGTKVKPKDDKTVHTPDELFTAAIAHIQAQKPKTDPLIALLTEYSYGADLGVRSGLRNQMAPTKPVDEDKAIEQAAKKLVAIGYATDLADGIAKVRAMKTA